MQDLSFVLNDPRFTFNGFQFSIQVFTFENSYGLDGDNILQKESDGTFNLECTGLTWANGQEKTQGEVKLQAAADAKSTKFSLQVKTGKTIRSVKLLLHGLPKGNVINLRETPLKEIPDSGLVLHYPEGWRNLYTPLVVIRTVEGKFIYFRSLDPLVRDKKFAFLDKGDTFDVELIFEEDATRMINQISVPAWEIGYGESLEQIMAEQQVIMEKNHNLIPWEEREDVPAWAKDISLVASIHCQHWNGYIFNDYEKVLNELKWLAERIDPKHIMAYLPGWEGRYYWQYGDYRPDVRMGGEAGFARLISEAKAMGIRVMPMFGMNVVNRGLENFEQWGKPSLTYSAGGFPMTGSVDWDASRHFDHGSNAMLNPGAPGWQNRLVGQVTGLMDKYGFNGVFLDISAAWVNDPFYLYYDGMVELCRRIRENHPDCYIAGEGWYDAHGTAIPLTQSGHTDGIMHYHDEPYAELFDKYNRCFGHLCLGDPSRGSTGGHELGYNLTQTRTPIRKGVIPTITIVEDTISKAPDKVMEIIEDAREYAKRFLNN